MRGLLASASSAVCVEFRRRQMLDMQERRSEYVNFVFVFSSLVFCGFHSLLRLYNR
ncbi:unnamed protein product [Brassica oleracea]